jgi:diaminopropionate ammonia-lyase
MMGPLRCGEVSVLAFEAAFPLVTGFIAIDDDWAIRAMRRLARPEGGDPRLTAGASGAAALGGLFATLQDPAAGELREALALGSRSSVLLIISEGITDPPLWREVVGSA